MLGRRQPPDDHITTHRSGAHIPGTLVRRGGHRGVPGSTTERPLRRDSGSRPKSHAWLRATLSASFLFFLMLGSVGCGSNQPAAETSTTPSTSATPATSATTAPTSPTTSAPGTTTTAGGAQSTAFSIFLVQGEKVAPVVRPDESGAQATTTDRAAAAVTALLNGPTDVETSAPADIRLTTAIPAGTKLLGLSIAGDTATVDLTSSFGSGGGSLSMFLRIGQVVYTVTQFSGVRKVLFHMDGKPVPTLGGEGVILSDPVTRADSEGVTPAILVESPASGGAVQNPAKIGGTANVFEAVFWVEIHAGDGTVLVKQKVTASSGTGTRGTFSADLPYPVTTGPGKVVAYTLSPKDGTKTIVVVVPVTLGK